MLRNVMGNNVRFGWVAFGCAGFYDVVLRLARLVFVHLGMR
jgi:hypothetical protein